MPDISMCQDTTCPSRMSCFRYRAIPTEGRQSYGGFKHEPLVGQCRYFTPVWPDSTRVVPEKDLP